MTTALLVLDVQASLAADETPDPDEGLTAVTALVERARAAGGHVVWITDRSVGPDAAWHTALVPAGDELQVVRSGANAFEDTDLDAELTLMAIDQVVICGMQSDACVKGTTEGASELGYEVVLAADAHTPHARQGRDRQAVVAARNTALAALDRVRVLPSAEVDFSL